MHPTEALPSQVHTPSFLANKGENTQLSDEEVIRDLGLVAHQTWFFLQNHLDPGTGLPFDRVELRNGETQLYKITSPSNIGLALLSCVAGDKLSYIDKSQVFSQIKLLINSIESLKIKLGMFVNWYQTDTCQPVVNWPNFPEKEGKIEEFVSSVDNAWLAIGLLIVAEHFPELKLKIDKILDHMDFRIFFDESSNSFAGGIHQSEKLTDFHFPSTYLSEARILYYVSHLLGQMDQNTLKNYLDHFPNSSYGGSIFETLMPLLVFDEQELSSEAILNLINLQREAGKEHGYWGFSPCDDPGDNYKEFGVDWYKQNGFDVITPYALFLALPYVPDEVLTILQRLANEAKAWSENGFVDAVNVKKGITSNSWLFLDQAMIFLSIYQCLDKNNFRKKII